MSRAVWKFPFGVTDWCEFEMPAGARILHLDMQHDDVCIWAEVDVNAPKERRKFRTYGTGHPMDVGPQEYVGTYFVDGGRLVFHVYEQRN